MLLSCAQSLQGPMQKRYPLAGGAQDQTEGSGWSRWRSRAQRRRRGCYGKPNTEAAPNDGHLWPGPQASTDAGARWTGFGRGPEFFFVEQCVVLRQTPRDACPSRSCRFRTTHNDRELATSLDTLIEAHDALKKR